MKILTKSMKQIAKEMKSEMIMVIKYLRKEISTTSKDPIISLRHMNLES